MKSDFLRTLLLPFGFIYRILIFFRNFFYDVGVFQSKGLPCKVISVGNLSLGGTGKTPTVISLAQYLKTAGKSVAILSRGYKRSSKKTFLVSDGLKIESNWKKAGDEPVLLAQTLKGVPVVVDSDRFRGGCFLIEKFNPDVIILDDGFQHRQLARDLDIVLVNSLDSLGAFRLLPCGNLREPLKQLKRADMVFLTKTNLDKNLSALRLDYFKKNTFFKTKVKAHNLFLDKTNSKINSDKLKSKNCVLVSGIGDPKSFYKTAEGLNLNIVHHLVFSDHQVYRPQELYKIEEIMIRHGGDYILTTEKDLVKLSSLITRHNAQHPNGHERNFYFNLYSLPVSIIINETTLKKIYNFVK